MDPIRDRSSLRSLEMAGTEKSLARGVQLHIFVHKSRRPRIVAPVPVGASAVALGVFCLVAAINEPTPLDLAAYEWSRRRYSRRLEAAQRPIELFGLPGIYIPAALLLARVLRRKHRRGGVAITNGALAGWFALRLSRAAIHRPRPPRPPGRRPKFESTFPSGHTTGITALAVVAARVLRDEQILTTRGALALGAGLPFVTAMNRVYTREHWVTDVLGGWALGLSAALAVLGVSSPASSRAASSRA